ncbi:hypothetical protein A306_00006294 [Columba livia]|uniref:Uncharacterized protein n=1 Tax=Columba livia TaxID=8932 RepID=A0A2I0M7I3_COLLI|nr:hypothetical protein A306_00006294 [Columba livia]
MTAAAPPIYTERRRPSSFLLNRNGRTSPTEPSDTKWPPRALLALPPPRSQTAPRRGGKGQGKVTGGGLVCRPCGRGAAPGDGSAAETPAGDDFSLSLLDTNLPVEAETELRSFLAKRLTKGALFEGMGNVVSVGLSIPEYKVGCYYCRFQQENILEMATLESDAGAPEYVVCFLGGSEKGLEIHSDLSWTNTFKV